MTSNRGPAWQLSGSDDLSATVAADRAFPAAVPELVGLMRTTTILAALTLALTASVLLSPAAEKERFTVTIAPNAKLDASFHRKVKTKDRGWKVFIKFTNKTDKPIRSIATDYQLREGVWIILDSRTQTWKSEPLLVPRQSAVFGWIDGVPSSVDSIHIGEFEIE